MDRPKPFLSLSALALTVHFCLQLVAGVVLHTVYRADLAQAHSTTQALHDGPLRFLQAFHYWGSAVLIVQSALHLAAVTWAGWYRGPNVRGYVAALGFAALAFAFQVTGNVLPADRHGVQTAAVEGSIAARVPSIGPSLANAVLGGSEFSGRTLTLWHIAHAYLFPIALILVALCGLGVVARSKGPRWPALFPAALALALALFVASPLGSLATEADYGSYDAKPSWYTTPMHGFLVLGGWLGAMGVPALFGLALAAFPIWKPKLGTARTILVAFGFIGLVATVLSGGESASLVGTRDPKEAGPTVVQKERGSQDEPLAAKGKALFAVQGCNACHGKDGLQAIGGPSLANVWKTHPEAEYYERYVRDPQSVKKGSTMPAYGNLTPEELRALAEFLRFARKA